MGKRVRARRGPSFVGNVVLLIASVVLALAVAEVAARSLINPSVADHHKLLCEHDPLLGWRKVANARSRFTTSEYDIEEQINSKGLRGPEHDYAKPAGVTRILVLGDSFTEGYTVDFDDVFTEVLARQLCADSSRRVEVINAGTGGYSTDQELLFFRSEGRRYQPDLVLLMFVDNDVWFNGQATYPRAEKPLFRVEGGELVLTNAPVPDFSAQAPSPRTAPPLPRWNRIKSEVAARSALYRLVRDRVKGTYWMRRAAVRIGVAGEEDGEGPATLPDQWQVFRVEPTEAVRDAWRITEALLGALRDDVREAGADFLVVNIPPSFDLYEDRWMSIRRRYGIGDVGWSPSIVTRKLVEVCARNGIDLLDLTPDFAAAIEAGRDRPEPLFFPIDGHWTRNGHELAGERLATHLAIRRPMTSELERNPR